MRLIAASLVIYGHSYAISPADSQEDFISYATRGATFSGEISVVVFFFLSGALITKSAVQARTLRSYFVKRFLRIYPALVFCLLISVFIFAPIFGGITLVGIIAEPQTWRYLLQNTLQIYNEHFIPGVYEDHPSNALNGSLWSITLEIRLYLLVGLLLVFRAFSKIKIAVVVYCTLLIVLWLGNSWLPVIGSSNALLGSAPFPTFGAIFILGGLYFLIESKIRINWLTATFSLFLVALIFAPYDQNIFRLSIFGFSIAIMMLFAGNKWIASKFRLSADYSYGVYLFGWPAEQVALSMLNKFGWGGEPLTVTFLALGLAFSFALVSWKVVERPMLKLATQLSSR